MKRKTTEKPQRKLIKRAIILILLAYLIFTKMYSPAEAKTETVYITYIVQPGDRLWNIANKYKKPGTDTREKISQIISSNKDKDLSYIYPGEEISIKIEP